MIGFFREYTRFIAYRVFRVYTRFIDDRVF